MQGVIRRYEWGLIQCFTARYIFVMLIFVKLLQNGLSLSICLEDFFLFYFLFFSTNSTWIWHSDKLCSLKKSSIKSFILDIMKTFIQVIYKRNTSTFNHIFSDYDLLNNLSTRKCQLYYIMRRKGI